MKIGNIDIGIVCGETSLFVDLFFVKYSTKKRQNPVVGIYKITSPVGKVNIGQAIDIENRFYKYKKMSCEKQTKLYNSFKKYGVDNHKFEIINLCNREELNHLEVSYIKFYDSFNTHNGLNLTSGGSASMDISDETRLRMSESHKGHKAWNKGNKMPEEQRLIMCGEGNPMFGVIGNKHPNYGKPKSDEQKQKQRDKMMGKGKGVPNFKNRGRVQSKETIRKRSEAMKGRKPSPQTIEAAILSNTKRVASYETRLKQSKSKIGVNNPNYGKTGSKNHNYGRVQTDEHKKNATESWLRIRQEKLTMVF